MNTVIITGASQGLGLTIANRFAAQGWNVIGTGRSPRPDGLTASARYEQFDAADSAENEAFWQRIKADLDGEVCLVNNAGGYISGRLLETKPEDYEKQIQSIYYSAVFTTHGLAGIVPKAKIINVISAGALTAHPGDSAYGAAKAAEMHFFQALQLEFEPTKYQITNIYPGDIASHGTNPKAIDPVDLADFIIGQAESAGSYYLSDVTLYPSS